MPIGNEWKDLRVTFTPIFSPGKLKTMSHLIGDIAVNQLCRAFEVAAASGREIQLNGIGSKFSMETIASCAFGINAQTFDRGDKSPFARYTEEGLRRHDVRNLKIANVVGPSVFRVLSSVFGFSIFKRDMTMFFYNTVSKTVEHRLATGERRNDLIDMMIDVLNEGQSSGEAEIPDDAAEQYFKDAKLDHRLHFVLKSWVYYVLQTVVHS